MMNINTVDLNGDQHFAVEVQNEYAELIVSVCPYMYFYFILIYYYIMFP